MPVRLTETAINKALREATSGQRHDLADAGCPGLRLRLTPTGSASWVLACRDRQGRMRRFPIGSYPAKGISDARSEARRLHGRVKQDGADPIAERRRERAMGTAAKAGIGTLSAMLKTYGEKRGDAQKTWGEARKRIDLVLKPLLAKPIAALTRSDVQMEIDAYPSAASASFVVRSVRPALKWAAQRHYLSEDVSRIEAPATVRRRKRVLSRDELAALLPALSKSQRPHAAALLFMLMTLARRQEVVSARWRDIDLQAGTWSIAETKNGEPHVVPLPRQALDLLRSVGTGRPNDLVFATPSGGALSNWDRETKAIQKASGTNGWHRHDLRRTGATMLGEMGEMPDTVEAALNHTHIRSPLAATYNRSRYRPQVAAALQRLADAYDGIAAGAGQVVAMVRPVQG